MPWHQLPTLKNAPLQAWPNAPAQRPDCRGLNREEKYIQTSPGKQVRCSALLGELALDFMPLALRIGDIPTPHQTKPMRRAEARN